MAVEFEIREPREYPRVSSFLNEYWAKNHVYTWDRKLFDWSFHRFGHWYSNTYSFSLALDGVEWSGHPRGNPIHAESFWRIVQGGLDRELCDPPGSPQGRHGITALEFFPKPEFSAVVAFGINPATAAIIEVLRGQVLPEIPRQLFFGAAMPGRAHGLCHQACVSGLDR